ncbi:MAG: fatty acid CoA ligase family protein, partial [Pseudomonadota bacterium]
MAEIQPYKKAVVCPAGRDRHGRSRYTHYTFRQLDQESDRVARGLKKAGVDRGLRTILMVMPSLEFFVLVFALFKVGAVPVVVDPGMGLGRMLLCLRESRPEAFIGIPKAHLLRLFRPKYFQGVKIWITVGRRWFWGGLTMRDLRSKDQAPLTPADTRRDETAAVIFTTGSTGPAKGAIYTHGNFDAQLKHVAAFCKLGPDEVDLPTFPLFALFDPALGMTAVIPDMDPTKPGFVNPQKIIEPIFDHGVTNMFASPALLNRVGRYAQAQGLKLPSLRRVVSAGAPVLPDNVERFASLLQNGAQVHTPYGATEAVPVTSIGSDEILSETKERSRQGGGACVGRPLDGLEVRIIRITDDPVPEWSDELALPEGEIGEFAVKGDHVTRGYFNRPQADRLSKIKDGRSFWHRLGDVGWRDEKGRLWFCGRKSHRVITGNGALFTIPCEAIFNNHPQVLRSALVGVGAPPHQKPVICIELERRDGRIDLADLKRELLELGQISPLTKN